MSEYISRNEARQELRDARGIDGMFDKWGHGYCAGITEAIDIIDNIPPADVAPVVHGHWKIYEHKDSYGVLVTGYQCSNCGEGISYNEWRQEHFSDYCSECGCKMDESEDEQ